MLFSRCPTHRKMSINLRLLGSTLNRVTNHKFLGIKLDEQLSWKPYCTDILGGAYGRINALKYLSAKSLWRKPEWVVSLHDAVINSIWKYGCLFFVGMDEFLWARFDKLHSKCVKSYAGVPNYVNYGTVCNHLSIRKIRDELGFFAKKRLMAILTFSPFGKEIIDSRVNPEITNYKSATNVLTNEEAELIKYQLSDE